jgi:hypothetical protein
MILIDDLRCMRLFGCRQLTAQGEQINSEGGTGQGCGISKERDRSEERDRKVRKYKSVEYISYQFED